MMSVYQSFHHMVKYVCQRYHILQYLIGLEIKISMKASNTENQFEIGFLQPKTVSVKMLVLTSLVCTRRCSIAHVMKSSRCSKCFLCSSVHRVKCYFATRLLCQLVE